MITIELPWPHPALAPNRANGKHWAGVAAIKSKAKGDAFLLTKAVSNGLQLSALGKYQVEILFVAPDNRRRDLDGLLSSMKHALDGVAQALGLDDSQFRPMVIDRYAGNKPGKVIVTVDA